MNVHSRLVSKELNTERIDNTVLELKGIDRKYIMHAFISVVQRTNRKLNIIGEIKCCGNVWEDLVVPMRVCTMRSSENE